MYNFKYYCVKISKFIKERILYINKNTSIDIALYDSFDCIHYRNCADVYSIYLNRDSYNLPKLYFQIRITIREKYLIEKPTLKNEILLNVNIPCFTK